MSSSALQTGNTQLVVFLLEGRRFAVELGRVDRVLPMVALAVFPRAPAIIAGVFDLHGDLIPVVNLRRRFRLPERPAKPSDQMIIVRTGRRRLALAVDSVENVVSLEAGALASPEALVPGLDLVRGIAQLPEQGIVFVHDIDACLSLEEEAQLEAALREVTS